MAMELDATGLPPVGGAHADDQQVALVAETTPGTSPSGTPQTTTIELDAAGKVLTLNVDGPSMAGDGKIVKYQDIVEVMSDDHRTLTSQMQMPDGTWSRFMTAHYRRIK